MNKPPVMISTKDSMYVGDILNVTAAFIKKFRHYDNEIQDNKIKQLVLTITSTLKGQYTKLMEVLKSE